MKKLLAILLLIFYTDAISQYLFDKRINEVISTYLPTTCKFSINSSNNLVFSWIDLRDTLIYSPQQKIFAQRVNSFINVVGENIFIPINDSLIPRDPSVLYLENGYIWMSWVDASATQYSSIRSRFFDSTGVPQNNLVRLNDPSQIILWSTTPVVLAKNKKKLISVLNYGVMPNPTQIYLQLLDFAGNKIGNNMKINDDSTNTIKGSPGMAVRRDGGYIIVWMDKRDNNTGAADIYLQQFDSQDNRIGVNRKVNDDSNKWIHQDKPSIATDSAGNFVIVWEDYRINDVYINIFAQYFDASGNPVGQNIRVDHGFTAWDRYMPKVAMSDSGNIVIAWTDDDASDPTTVYFKRYNPSWIPLGNQRKISNQAPQSLKVLNDCKLKGDRIMTAWTDYRNNGYDIYYNVISFQNPDSIISNTINTSSIIPDKFYLHQNYPNPFNPTTHLQFGISKLGFVSLKVYDVLGTEVAILVNETKPIGSYKVEFDGYDLASSIYFYSLEVDGNIIDTKRMLLLK